MAIVAMKHLRLLGMESEREALLKAMQDMECVEISSIDGSEEALKSGFAKPDDKALMSAQEASRAYRTALASLDRFAPEKKGMFRKRQGVSRAAFFSAESEENARTAAETINKDTRRLGEIESERTKNEALRATLAPWLTVDAPLGGADGALSRGMQWQGMSFWMTLRYRPTRFVTSSYIPTLPGKLFYLKELAGPLCPDAI